MKAGQVAPLRLRRSGSSTGRPVVIASQQGPSPRSNWISSMRAMISSLAESVSEPSRPPSVEMEAPATDEISSTASAETLS